MVSVLADKAQQVLLSSTRAISLATCHFGGMKNIVSKRGGFVWSGFDIPIFPFGHITVCEHLLLGAFPTLVEIKVDTPKPWKF